MPLQNWAAFLLLSSSTPFNLKMSSKNGDSKNAGNGTASNKKAEGSESNSREQEKIKAKNKKYTNTSKTDCKQQRAKRDNHGFVLILCNNAILFRHFSPTV